MKFVPLYGIHCHQKSICDNDPYRSHSAYTKRSACAKTEEMPIKIYIENTFDKIAWLCNDTWDLPNQIVELEKWLHKNCQSFPNTKCVIDIGFDIRKDSSGGV